MGKASAWAKLPMWLINLCLSLDRDRMKAFISGQIRQLVWIFNVCGIIDEWSWDLV
jgi:hypothetical protein